MSAARSKAFVPGNTVAGKYETLRPLGHGGMGRVFAARNLATHKQVALKWMLDQHAEGSRARFLREAQAAGRIHHPNVVDVYDVLETDDGPCIVMELLQGETLAGLLRRQGRLPVPAALRIALEIAKGLGAAHREGVIHRDLKPGNVFLTDDVEPRGVKILDFGVSKLMPTTDAPATQSGLTLGTPNYMAPEQVLGTKEVTPAIDVYALGALIYEMLGGRPPHLHESVTALLVEIATVEPTPLVKLAPNVSSGLSDQVHRALAKNPAQRFASVGDLALALEPFAVDERSPTLGTPQVVLSAAPHAEATTNLVLPRTPPPMAASAAGPPLVLLHVERNLGVAYAGPVCICVWAGPVPHDGPRASLVGKHLETLRESSHRGLLLYVYVVAPDATIPDANARKVSARFPSFFDHSVGVHEGSDFRASLIRGVVTGMALMSPTRASHEVASTVAQAAKLLAPRARGMSAAQIALAIEQTRSAARG